VSSHRFSEGSGCRVVVPEPLKVVVERVQPRGGEDPGLPPAATEPLALNPGAGDVVRCRDQHRADGRTQPLRQAQGDGVEQRPIRPHRHSGGDMGVAKPGPVEMQGDARLAAALRDRSDGLVRLDRAAAEVVGVLQCDHTGLDDVRLRADREHRRDNVGIRHAAHRRERTGGHPVQRSVGAQLSPHDVRLSVAEHLLAGFGQQPDAQQVGQRPGRTEQTGLMAEQLCGATFELSDGGILPVHVVADLRAQHGLAHRRRRPGDGVRSQVDHVAIRSPSA